MVMHAAVRRGRRGSAVAGCSLALALTCVAPGHAADMAYGSGADSAPVYRCEITGFIELPSTDICLKIGGHARLVTSALGDNWAGTDGYYVRNIAIDGATVPSSGVLPTIRAIPQTDATQRYAQGRIHLDARTTTGYGTVRAFVEVGAVDNETRTGGSVNLRHAFVQFGNWTFGKTWSTFIDRDARVRTADPYKVVGDNGRSMRRSQIRYTQELGSGVSLAVAVEDQDYNSPPSAIVGIGPLAPLIDPAATDFSVVNDRNDVPDFVAALKWEYENIGSVQLSGALHQNKYAETQTIGGLTVQSFNDDDVGFALLFGLALNLPKHKYDTFTFLAVYTDGASQYLQDVYGSSTEIAWGRCGLANCILDQVTKKSVVSSLTHYWSDHISISFGAGYAETNYGALGTATAGLFGAPGVLDVATVEGFANIQWEAAGKTKFLFDVHYGHIDYRGFDLNPYVAGIQDSQGAWAATLQVTRQF